MFITQCEPRCLFDLTPAQALNALLKTKHHEKAKCWKILSFISGKTSLAPLQCMECEAELAANPVRTSAEHVGAGI
eukprot:345935-Chlamydomonas_euryale.AAC.1